jgi:DNA-binding transcriptional LysR family regulator
VQISTDRPPVGTSLAWDDIRHFLAVARGGSLSAAARQLGVEHSTVARRIAALEGRIGVRLFDRLPRSWALTDEGQALVGAAERLEDEALAFNRAAMAATATQGKVRVSAPPVFASHFLVPQLAARAAHWPGIVLEVIGETRSVNLHRREADVALRLMRPSEPGLAARKLGAMTMRLYAAPAWLARPQSTWQFVGYGEPLSEVPQQRLLARIAGERPFVLLTNDLAALHRACRAGLGLAMLPSFHARDDSALVEVPREEDPVLREIWSVIHPDVRRSPRVRLMADLIAEVVKENSALLL